MIAVGLGFDFTNGFHDTANYVATWVGTRALGPRARPCIVSAAANLAGAFVTTAVAKTVGQGIIDTGLATDQTVLAALLGAIAWNLLTWWLGLPSSSTHALIGGLAGAALAQSGARGVLWRGIWEKVILPGAASPVIGFAAAFVLLVVDLPALPPADARDRRTGASAWGSSCPEPGSPSPTAPTTHRRRWG